MIKRIIPRLDIKGPNLVKGICLEGLRALRSPEFFSKKYYNDGADEIIYHDVVASLYDRKTLLDLINKTSKECFIPLSVSGGIKTTEDISDILKNGGDKVFLNTAAIQNPEIITKAAKKFGSSTIGVSIEISISPSGEYYLLYNYGRELSNKNVFDWLSEIQDRGAGEICITSVNHEGYGEGMNLSFLDKIHKKINTPLIYHGGVGSFNHAFEVLSYDKVNAISISSCFHYKKKRKKNFRFNQEKEGNFDYLLGDKEEYKFKTFSIGALKKFLNKKKIKVRI